MFLKLLKFIFLVLVLTGCLATPIQDPRIVFENGLIPDSALRHANQMHLLPTGAKRSELIDRVTFDQNNKKLLKVGVMDNGVEIFHPDLINKIDMKFDGRNLVSAGFDAMGGDLIPSPVLVDYKIYAFGGELNAQGQIKNHADDPMALVKKYNDEFLELFEKKLSSSDSLQNSLFKNFTKDSFNLYDIIHLIDKDIVGEDGNYKRSNLEKSYKRRAETNKLIDFVEKMDSKYLAELKKAGNLDGVYKANFEPKSYYNMILRTFGGDFDAYDNFTSIKGGMEFYDLLIETYEDFNKNSPEFKKYLNNMSELYNLSQEGFRSTKFNQNASDRLKSISRYQKIGFHHEDPLVYYVKALENKIISMKLVSEGLPKERIKVSMNEIEEIFKAEISIRESLLNQALAKKGSVSADFLKGTKNQLEVLTKFKQQFPTYLESRSWKDFDLDNPKINAEDLSDYRKYFVRKHHPMFYDEIASHGTHVSGIISQQSDNLRIHPIRVMTSSTEKNLIKDEELLKKFKKELEEFFSDPVISKSFKDTFKDKLDGKIYKMNSSDRAKAIMVELAEEIDDFFWNHRLDIDFVNQISTTIDHIAKEKLKLVNVSLGTEFNKAILKPEGAELKQILEFYIFEGHKNKIASKMKKTAPNTMFLIATGNSGAWVDNHSKSAIPADLSSPFFRKYETKNVKLINNTVENLLAVGSVDRVGNLSSFSNILIGTKTPMIFAEGEAVYSPVRMIDSSEAGEKLKKTDFIANKNYWDMDEAFDKKKELIPELKKNEALKKYFTKEVVENEDLASSIMYSFFDEEHTGNKKSSFLIDDLMAKAPPMRAHFSGTSMATPTATGLIGRYITEKAEALGVPASDLYNDLRFKPSIIMEEVFALTKPIHEGANVITLKKLTGTLELVEGKRTKFSQYLEKIQKEQGNAEKWWSEKHSGDCNSLIK